MCLIFFFFNDTATTEIYTLSLHDALPICGDRLRAGSIPVGPPRRLCPSRGTAEDEARGRGPARVELRRRSEEHTSELQSRPHLVCRLLLEKKKKKTKNTRLMSCSQRTE